MKTPSAAGNAVNRRKRNSKDTPFLVLLYSSQLFILASVPAFTAFSTFDAFVMFRANMAAFFPVFSLTKFPPLFENYREIYVRPLFPPLPPTFCWRFHLGFAADTNASANLRFNGLR